MLGHSDIRTTMIYTQTVKSVSIKEANSKRGQQRIGFLNIYYPYIVVSLLSDYFEVYAEIITTL